MDYPEDFINKIICGDCLEVMKFIPNESIDLTITSPPYDNLRDYKGYTFNFEFIARELYRVTKEGGVVVWVVGDRVKNRSETLLPFHQAIYFKEIGFLVHDTMIYQKNAFPFPEQSRYAQVFEYMFVLSKDKPKTTNIIKVETNPKNRIKNKVSYQRQKNGTTTRMKYETGKKYRNRENVWWFNVGYMHTTLDKFAYKHPAMFPEFMVEDHIISWSNRGDLILDPMCGSGTTTKMAIKNNRNFIGIDISEEYCEISRKRINRC